MQGGTALQQPDTEWRPPGVSAAGRTLRQLVCVVICTCDRHDMLRRTLVSLERQSTGADFVVVVADNGRRPADRVVAEFDGRLDIRHERVSEPGLTAVRNRALALARESGACFMAGLDDDETAAPDWLAAHLAAVCESGADIQVGHIHPEYLVKPPGWIVEGGFFVDDSGVPTTANLLLRLSVLPEDEAEWFSPDYAATGGEDYDFISRLCRRGARYSVVPQARVADMVPAERLTLRFILRRGLRDGVYFGLSVRKEPWSRSRQAMACVAKVGAKLGYAFNHLLWSPVTPWRARRAGADLASALGIVLGFAGIKPHFYGHRPSTGPSTGPTCGPARDQAH
jgi:glycosyltransferase involved in cell wall biosynthesis